MVAPAEPVPLRRKTTRAPSPLRYLKNKINPCLLVMEPSTGSVYLNMNKKIILVSFEFLHLLDSAMKYITHENSSAPTRAIPEGSLSKEEKSAPSKSVRIKSIISLAASLLTAKCSNLRQM